jgi:hypothetical protein
MYNIKQIPISKVSLNENNPRFIKDKSFKDLVKSLKECPELFNARPLLCNTDYTILGGNMRYRAALELHYTEVPVIVMEGLTPDQEREIIIKDNGGFGSWDFEELANGWADLPLADWGVELPEDWLTEPEEAPEEEEPNLEPPKEPITVLGDLYELNEHRVHCADSTDSDAVSKLMDGKLADMVFTDPPYGIAHSGKGIEGATGGNDFGEILGDADVEAAKDSFNLATSLYPEATLIFWGANYYPSILPDGHGWIIWDKQREGETFSGAELAFVNRGVKVNVFRHQWHGMIKASEHGQSRVHPTQKPTALAEWCFANYGNPELVVDLFLGSHSTLLACEQTARTCYGQELDPQYCDVGVRRWVKYMQDNNRPYTVKRNGNKLTSEELNQFFAE